MRIPSRKSGEWKQPPEIFRCNSPMKKSQSQTGRRGHAVIEVSLMAPWVFFLFMGIVDFGFYAYASIATEGAARVAVEQTSTDANSAADVAIACTYALGELKSLPNMMGVTGCASSASAITSSQPVAVTAAQVVGADGTQASQVTVTYQTIPMIPIPGVMGQFTLSRTAQMRLRDQ
jgi:Flp pilus assembly protein TadG